MRILIVEDEQLVAMLLEDILENLGYTIVGPAATLEEGLSLATREPIDAAILDVNLNGARSFPIADALTNRSVPHLFATGYGSAEAVTRRGAEVVRKPFREEMIAAALRRVTGRPHPCSDTT
jgi:DNA-binding response OmpR family regulator